ncbi:TetR/AcrR family transcriptional regulator [Streptomyces sp. NPDC058417]|uniref:TetR/AcrR family transcriptional regulator n=1 Tax=unclassified Streptomyces TaxID=2593676 RepID=UPI0036574B38
MRTDISGTDISETGTAGTAPAADAPAAPGGPDAPAARPGARDRLLTATAELSYREGVGIGVEALCRAAGVSKRSMYQLFDSKDELLAASLVERTAAVTAAMRPPADSGGTPRARVLYVFERVQEQAVLPDYRGCPFLAVQVELKNPDHPASLAARRVKDDLAAFFRGEAERGGAADPALLTRQLMLLFDGASARAGIGVDDLSGLILPTVTTLLDAAGLR